MAKITIEKLEKGDLERFWGKVEICGPDDCWEWRASTVVGYGKLNLSGRLMLAHRVAWELTNGAIPDGLCVLHRCDNRPCVNPAHLFLGTKLDNARDRDKKGRKGNNKLDAAKVREIRQLYAAGGTSHRKLARQFNISPTQVSRIVNFQRWGAV